MENERVAASIEMKISKLRATIEVRKGLIRMIQMEIAELEKLRTSVMEGKLDEVEKREIYRQVSGIIVVDPPKET